MLREHDHVTADAPSMVGIIVVNYFGGDMTVRCLESLEKLTWPRERLAVCLVDNGSEPGWPDQVRARFSDLRLVESRRNLGFGGACNLGFEALRDCEYLALLNNDAIPDPGWLEPLVDALDADPRCGAANPKVLLDGAFLPLRLESEASREGGGDTRALGVQVRRVRVDDVDASGLELRAGFWGWEADPTGEAFAWTDGDGIALVCLPGDNRAPDALSLEVVATAPRLVKATSGSATATATADARRTWVELRSPGPALDVINNAGTVLLADGSTADRGYLEPDDGRFDDTVDVFGWSGAAVLFSRPYLDDVGAFDARYFLYSEDADLAWRGRLRSWSYRYVPASVVRHQHSATIGARSALTRHLAARNRLVLLTKLAPRSMLLPALGEALSSLARALVHDVVTQAVRGRRPVAAHVLAQARVLLGYVRMAPRSLIARYRLRPDRQRDAILRWVEREP